MSESAQTNPSHTNVGKATGKAGAYGGSELGSLVGGAVGPPVIGGIVGNLVGERVGEKAIHKTGIDEKVREAGDELAGTGEFVTGSETASSVDTWHYDHLKL